MTDAPRAVAPLPPEVSQSQESPGARLRRLVIALLVGGGALAYTFSRIDWPTFGQALRSIQAGQFLLFTGANTVFMLAADATATSHVYRRTIGPTRWSDVFVLRGASYLPSLLNYHLGQALFTWFLSKRHGAPVWRVAGATLLCYATTFAGLGVLCAGSWFLAPNQFPWLLGTLLTLVGLGIVYLVLLRSGAPFLSRLEATRVLAEAGLSGHLRHLASRLPHIVVLYVGMWVPFLFFDISIPFVDSLVLVPVLLLVSAFPLTPQGLGPREVVALELFAPYAAGTSEEGAARIAACSISWAVSMTLWEALVGLALTPRLRSVLTRVGTPAS